MTKIPLAGLFLLISSVLSCGSLAANESEQEQYFESISKGFWQSEESVINSNKTLFTNFCAMSGISFERFRQLILSNGMINPKEKIAAMQANTPHLLREYTEEERTALFVYLNGYTALLMQYAEQLKETIEKQECNHFYFEKFRSVMVGLLTSVLTRTWQGFVAGAVLHEVMTYFVACVTDLPFLADYKANADWQFLFEQRILAAETCQVMNLRPR